MTLAAPQERPALNPVPPQRPRLAYVDALKVAAILAVASIHIYGVAIGPNPVGSVQWWLAAVAYYSSFWAVPVFVMASGAVVIGSGASPREFYRRRAARIAPAAALFVPLYMAFAARFQDGPATLGGVIGAIASGRPYNHLYFLPLIAGLYAVTPLLARALRDAPRTWLWTTAIALLAMSMADVVLGYLGGGGIAPTLVTWWIPYVGYYVLGYAIATARFMAPTTPLALATIAAIAVTDVLVWLALTSGSPALGSYTGTYLSVPVVLVSVLVFVTFRSAEAGLARFRSPLEFAGLLTFGVFLGHVLVGSALFQVLRPDHTVLGLTPVYLGTVALSFVIAGAASRIPVIRRFIGV